MGNHTNRLLWKYCTAVFGLLLASVFMTKSVNAQTWAYTYGSASCNEGGFRGVTTVVNCNGGGYVSCGYSTYGYPSATCGNEDVYVVRTNTNGTPIWEYTYSFSGGSDVGTSIKELPNGNGFIVVGTTIQSRLTPWIFLMKIDCNGIPVWSKYYKASLDDSIFVVATDVVVATNAPTGTNVGDYIVSGWIINPADGLRDALLFRASVGNAGRAPGSLRWNRSYHHGLGEHFNALVEANATGAGDIIAAGVVDIPGGVLQGYLTRFDGSSGLITNALHGTASYGQAWTEEFQAVIELLDTGAENGNIVATGWTNQVGLGSSDDIFTVKTTNDPCTKLAMQIVGDTGVSNDERAFDLKEILTGSLSSFAPRGDIALTGRTRASLGAGYEAFVLPLAISTLAPGSGVYFGDAGNGGAGDEVGHSITIDGSKLVVCGYSTGNLEGANPADPYDLYLVRVNGINTDECSVPWTPDTLHTRSVDSCMIPTTATPLRVDTVAVSYTSRDWDVQICYCQSCKRAIRHGNPAEPEEKGFIDLSRADQIAYPNPISAGGILTIGMLNMPVGTVDIVVTNSAGDEVYRGIGYIDSDNTQINLEAEEWTPGTYFVRLAAVKGSVTVSVVVH